MVSNVKRLDDGGDGCTGNCLGLEAHSQTTPQIYFTVIIGNHFKSQESLVSLLTLL